MSKLMTLLDHGQSVWLDYIDRNLVNNGGLKEMVGLGVRGVTSNPTIFEKAITKSRDYDAAIRDLIQADHAIDANVLYHWLTLQDIQAAADLLHDVYVSSEGVDGYVSLEVSPHLANDTNATIEAARTLWRHVKRPNLMIKVPATSNAVPAIETLIAENINVNVTLLFSVSQYEAIAGAYLRGLQKNPDPKHVASVASFFVSRIDSKVDPLLDKIGSPAALELKGKIAVANAEHAYQRFNEIIQAEEYRKQFARGANKQRMLWASTSVKNPEYPELLYVESLVGDETINTMPPETLETFMARGNVRSVLEDSMEINLARRRLKQICEQLLEEGIASFARSYD
ncbi:MAG: transaldolase, partial [Gammaproteobacteria bacterium]|nr:transaldolase [Gammaproteobacteria bacterium]